MDTKLYQ